MTIRAAAEQPQSEPRLPEYAAEMKHFHCAFAAELKAIVDSLPIAPEMHVIDIGCGDGFYLDLFASHLDERGIVTGFDSNRAYLDVARQRMASHDWLCDVHLVNGDVEYSSLPRGQCDLAWCAHSLFSLPEPSSALQTMVELIRPGGIVAILENDTLHQLLLPWPADMELQIRTAQFQALTEKHKSPDKFYVGRELPQIFAGAGLDLLNLHVHACTRRFPFDEHLAAFLNSYLARLLQTVRGRLGSTVADTFAGFIDPESDSCLLRQPAAAVTLLNTIAWGRKESL